MLVRIKYFIINFDNRYFIYCTIKADRARRSCLCSSHRKHREAVNFHLDLLLCLYVAIQLLHVDVGGLHVLDVNGFFTLGFYTFREREVVGLHFSGVIYAEPVL